MGIIAKLVEANGTVTNIEFPTSDPNLVDLIKALGGDPDKDRCDRTRGVFGNWEVLDLPGKGNRLVIGATPFNDSSTGRKSCNLTDEQARNVADYFTLGRRLLSF